MVSHLLNVVSVLAALIAAVLWFYASKVDVPAPSNTAGVGGLIGGFLIGLNPKNERIDLIATTTTQSLWNARAAFASAISATCAGATPLFAHFGY